MVCRLQEETESEVSETRSEDSDDQGYPVDNGPTPVGRDLWRLNITPDLMPDEVLLGMGGRIQPMGDPYYYHDALRDGILEEVLFPRMIETWFRNREMDMFWRGPGRQAYHWGKPVRQLAYGNCYNCLRAGGLTQICGFCGGENRFNAMVLHDTIDIPNTVVNARFLHRLVGYPDQDHDPNIDGTRPGGALGIIR